jgi:hypothetical protein
MTSAAAKKIVTVTNFRTSAPWLRRQGAKFVTVTIFWAPAA